MMRNKSCGALRAPAISLHCCSTLFYCIAYNKSKKEIFAGFNLVEYLNEWKGEEESLQGIFVALMLLQKIVTSFVRFMSFFLACARVVTISFPTMHHTSKNSAQPVHLIKKIKISDCVFYNTIFQAKGVTLWLGHNHNLFLRIPL